MISLGLSLRDRRTLLIGAVAMGSIVALGRGLPALHRWEVARVSAAAETRDQLIVAERGAASIDWVRDSAATRARRLEAQRSLLIKAATAEAAAAALASLVEKLSRDEGADILTMTLRPDSSVRLGLARVAVRFSAEGDVDAMVNLLFALETHDRPLVVRELSVTQPEPAAPPSRMETLRFELTVEALARVGAAPPKRVTAERVR